MGVFTFNNLLSAVKTNGLSESFLPPMILNMSITASVIILFVLLARLALKKAPKIFSYMPLVTAPSTSGETANRNASILNKSVLWNWYLSGMEDGA